MECLAAWACFVLTIALSSGKPHQSHHSEYARGARSSIYGQMGWKGGVKRPGQEECRSLEKEEMKMAWCPKRGDFPVQNVCKVFLNCMIPGDRPRTACCPVGLYFDHKLRKCIEQHEAQCMDVCPKYGLRFPNPYTAFGFLQCTQKGIPEEMMCQGNYRYVPQSQKCERVVEEVDQMPILDPDVIQEILAGYEIFGIANNSKSQTPDKQSVKKNETKVKESKNSTQDFQNEGAEKPVVANHTNEPIEGTEKPAAVNHTTEPIEGTENPTANHTAEPVEGTEKPMANHTTDPIEEAPTGEGSVEDYDNSNFEGHGRSFSNRSHTDCDPSLRSKVKSVFLCPSRGNFPIKGECRLFFKCLEKGQRPYFACCPIDLHFDHKLRRCIEVPQAKCIDVCKEANETFPDPDNPYGFLRCSKKGIPEPVQCPDNEHYVVQKKACGPFDVLDEIMTQLKLDDEIVKQLLIGYEFPLVNIYAEQMNETEMMEPMEDNITTLPPPSPPEESNSSDASPTLPSPLTEEKSEHGATPTLPSHPPEKSDPEANPTLASPPEKSESGGANPTLPTPPEKSESGGANPTLPSPPEKSESSGAIPTTLQTPHQA